MSYEHPAIDGVRFVGDQRDIEPLFLALSRLRDSVEEAERVIGGEDDEDRALLARAWKALHRLSGGELCEGCGSPATKHDADFIPLCAACYATLDPNGEPRRPVPPEGFFGKYIVRRTDCQDMSPSCRHFRCEYFVLDLTHDAAARSAARRYAEEVARSNPALSKDLLAKAAARAEETR